MIVYVCYACNGCIYLPLTLNGYICAINKILFYSILFYSVRYLCKLVMKYEIQNGGSHANFIWKIEARRQKIIDKMIKFRDISIKIISK